MSEFATTPRSLQAVARELDVSPAKLRRWSDEFAGYLSEAATVAHNQQYHDADIALLIIIKELMREGMDYEQIRQKLNGHTGDSTAESVRKGPATDSEEFVNGQVQKIVRSDVDEEDEERALVAADGPEAPAIAFLTNTLSTLSDSQKSILNSQAANRELLGVLLQDNFNLKEENNRLRERVLEIERNLAKKQQEDEWRREALRQELETKISAANQLASEAITTARAVEAPEIKAVESKPGCLGMLLGGGGPKIVTVPRRRKPEPREPGSPGASRGSTAAPADPPGKHPKPLFPPE